MEWYHFMFLLISTVAFLIMRVMQEAIIEQKGQIDKLHLECENYLQLLAKENIIPEIIVEGKIKQMNKKYGEVKLRIK